MQQGATVTLDQAQLDNFMKMFGTNQAAAMHAATVVLGEQLGLYGALAEAGPQTPDELAAATGYQPRLVREWLRAQAVNDYCAHDEASGTYWLTPEQRACLADRDSPTFLAGGLVTVSAVHRAVEQVADAFRGRTEVAWGDHDPALFSGTERAFRSAYGTHLVSSWIPALGDVEPRLREGGRIADVACGFGSSAIMLAEGYPAASVAGFDSHDISVATARKAAAEAGVSDRVTFEVADARELPGSGYDLVCVFNALHEMGEPVQVCRRIREVLADGGSLMIVEPVTGDTLEDNRTPVGRSFTSVSTMVCLPSAISQGGSWHLGAQAPDTEFAAVAAEAGFAELRRVAETPLHRVLKATP